LYAEVCKLWLNLLQIEKMNSDLDMLVNMGFPEAEAKSALQKSFNRIEGAIAILTGEPPFVAPPSTIVGGAGVNNVPIAPAPLPSNFANDDNDADLKWALEASMANVDTAVYEPLNPEQR
jgi:hypothetical protein